jgi:ribonucleoside-diphosphate reductase alpha chain
LCKYKNDKLNLQTEKEIYRYKDYVSITDINWEDSVEDVYDITVHDDTHAFYDAGVVTHNCVETSLRPNTFCNLVEINGELISSQEELNDVSQKAAFINTLQASYTDFIYLRSIWRKNTEKDALIGVGITGIGSGKLDELDKEQSAKIVMEENERVAKLIGINKAARCTVVKPSGTSSIVLGTSSGIHAYHNNYYMRRVRVNKNEAIYTHLAIHHPELVEDELFNPKGTAVISIPQQSPKSAHIRTESALKLLTRVDEYNTHWVRKGHRTGPNYHNVSATISIKPEEWKEVGDWIWAHRNKYHGLSVLPYSDHVYAQAPFEDCNELEYNTIFNTLKGLDLSKVVEFEDNTDLKGEAACSGDGCAVQ